jgi:hypothetical protein
MKTRSPWNACTARRFDDPRIIEFKPRLRALRKRHVPPIIDPLLHLETHEYRMRMQQNFLAITVLIVILGAGLCLYHELAGSLRSLTCIEADHTNCAPIDRR